MLDALVEPSIVDTEGDLRDGDKVGAGESAGGDGFVLILDVACEFWAVVAAVGLFSVCEMTLEPTHWLIFDEGLTSVHKPKSLPWNSGNSARNTCKIFHTSTAASGVDVTVSLPIEYPVPMGWSI